MATMGSSSNSALVQFGHELVPKELLEEFQQLQSQLRDLEARARTEKRHSQLENSRSEAELQRQLKERSSLKSRLHTSSSAASNRESAAEKQRLLSLIAERQSLEQLVQAERHKQQHLEALIREQQRRAAKVAAGNAASADAGKQEAIILMEKKLQSYEQKYRTTLHGNRQLREVIDGLRADREKFLKLQSRLQAELNSLHQLKSRMSARASDAFRSREEARRRQLELQQREILLAAEHRERVRSFQRKADDLADIRSFLRTKLHERPVDPQLLRLRQLLETRSEQQQIREAQRIDFFKEAFDLMCQRYKASDYEQMVQRFLQEEDRQYSMFRRVAEQQSEAAELEAEVAALSAALRRSQLEEAELSSTRAELASQLASDASDAKVTRLRRAEQLKVTVDALVAAHEAVRRIADLCGIDDNVRAAALGLAANDDRSGWRGVLQLLGLLEPRIFDLLALRSFQLQDQRRGQGEERSNAQLGGRIRLPSVGDEIDGVGEGLELELGDSPLTRDQLAARMRHRVLAA